MRKASLLMFVLAFGVSSMALAAPERTGKTEVGVDLAAGISTDSEVNTATYFGGNVSWGLSEWLAIGASFGYQNFSSDDSTIAGVTIFGSDLSAYPLFADILLRAPMGDNPLVPYGLLGLGVIFWDASDTFTSSGLVAKTDVDASFGIKVGGGVDWFLNDHWILNFNGSYVFSDSDAKTTVTGSGISSSLTERVDLDYWTIGGGLKYQF